MECGRRGFRCCRSEDAAPSPCKQGSICVGATCAACGGRGELCCSGGTCAPSATCNGDGFCELTCGAEGLPCCDTDVDEDPEFPLGYDPGCPFYEYRSGGTGVLCTDGLCTTCGALEAACCPESFHRECDRRGDVRFECDVQANVCRVDRDRDRDPRPPGPPSAAGALCSGVRNLQTSLSGFQVVCPHCICRCRRDSLTPPTLPRRTYVYTCMCIMHRVGLKALAVPPNGDTSHLHKLRNTAHFLIMPRVRRKES